VWKGGAEMKWPILSIGDVIQIKWIDANSPPNCLWQTVKELKEESPIMEILSVGYYVETRNEYIRLSGERSASKKHQEIVDRVFNVPIGCIKSIRRMK
jgi:ribulose bisphosphate carboxylase small subunit